MLYSLNAITSYGRADIDLAAKWQLLGALEALNGWILFGLTAAFLFTNAEGMATHLKPTNGSAFIYDPLKHGRIVNSGCPLESLKRWQILIGLDTFHAPSSGSSNLRAVRGSGMKTRMVVFWLFFFLAVPLLAREKNDVIIMRNGDRITYGTSSGVAWKFGNY